MADLRKNGPEALPLYLRNIRLALYARASHIILEMKNNMDFVASIGTLMIASLVVFVGCFIVVPTILGFCASSVFTSLWRRGSAGLRAFRKVRLVLDEPGLHFPIATALSWRAAVREFLRRRAGGRFAPGPEYLRSQPVQFGRRRAHGDRGLGTRCGSAIRWLIFQKNADPRGSLRPTSAMPRCVI